MISISEIKELVNSPKGSAVEQVEAALKRAEDSQDLNIFLAIYRDQALEVAKKVDDKLAKGDKVGKLAGVPFAVKDNFLVKDTVTTAASNFLKDYEASYTATAVAKLLAEDAILIGKLNLDAFAHGSSTENSAFGPTKNPVDPIKVPGGSSGGSAAVVAQSIVPFSLGSDTGGSIRLPASFCGTVGFKPTYGMVSRYGVVAMASSTDCIGPLTSNVADAQLIMEIIKGKDVFDSTTIESDEISFEGITDTKLKFGVIKEFNEHLDKESSAQLNSLTKKLEAEGHTFQEVSIPTISMALPCYYVLVPAEVSSNLARYDGVRYGSRASNESLDDLYSQSRSSGFELENIRRIMIGTYVLSSGFYDAYYKKAQQVRTKLINEFQTIYDQVDVLIGPVAPFPAFDIGGKVDDPLQMYAADVMTVSSNLVGCPSMSLPGLKVRDLPFGVQLMSKSKSDGLLLAAAKQIERII